MRPLDWRVEYLRRAAQLPAGTLQPLFFDFQWSAARRHQGQLAEAARRMEVHAAANAKIRVVDSRGNLIDVEDANKNQ